MTRILTIGLVLMAAVAGAGEFDSTESWWYQKALIDDGILGRLKLSAQQKARYDELAKEFEAKRELWLNANREKLRMLEQARDAAMAAGDAPRADALQKEYRDKLKELVETRMDLVKKFRAELTPEQQKELDDALEKGRKQAETGTPRKTS